MILFTRDLLFVHNPKTAGTSALSYLKQVLDGPIHTAGVAELGTYHPHLSLALGYACAITGNRPEDFRRITSFTRNPYAREVSMHAYFQGPLYGSPSRTRDLNDPRMETLVEKAHVLEFPEYLAWLSGSWGTCDIWRSRYFASTDDGEVPKALVTIRSETAAIDLPRLISDAFDTVPETPFPWMNPSPHADWRTLYDPETEEIVFQSYRWLFEAGLYQRWEGLR